MKEYFVIAVLLICSNPAIAQQAITPNHVFQKTQQIISELEHIREASGVTDTARSPGVQTNKRPLHVYSKALEVFEKIARYQKKLGMELVDVGELPLTKITPADVFNQAESILDELARIRTAQGIQNSTDRFSLPKTKGPSDVYELMWKASYLLDALAGQTSPNEVFRNAQYIEDELDLIGVHLNIDAKSFQRATNEKKNPKDVNLEAFKILHKVGRLERYLDMKPINPSVFPSGKILPTDVLDATNTILAELVRIKVVLNVDIPRGSISVPTGKTPTEVYEKMVSICAKLDLMLGSDNIKKPIVWADVASR